jgi:hypothetical protein
MSVVDSSRPLSCPNAGGVVLQAVTKANRMSADTKVGSLVTRKALFRAFLHENPELNL